MALDVFMSYATRFRWAEVRDMWPSYEEPNVEIQHVDDSWIGARTRTTFTQQESDNYHSQFDNYRRRKQRQKQQSK